jgi:hypothetical protein
MVDRWRFSVHSDWVGGSLVLPIVRIFTILRKNLNRYLFWGIPNWFIDTSVWVLSHLSHQKVRLVMKCRILFLGFFFFCLFHLFNMYLLDWFWKCRTHDIMNSVKFIVASLCPPDLFHYICTKKL